MSSIIFFPDRLLDQKVKEVLSENKLRNKSNVLYSHRLSPRHRGTVWPPKETQQCPLAMQVKLSCVTWAEQWTSAPAESPEELQRGTSDLHIYVLFCEISTTKFTLFNE